MASTRPHLPGRSFTRYKDVLVPRRFSSNPLPLFCSLPLSHFPTPPPRASGRAQLHILLCQALSPHRTDTTRSATADSYSLDASAILSRWPSDSSTLDSDADEAPSIPADRQRFSHATALDAGLPPSNFVHQSITPPVSTVIDEGRISTLTRCVTAASPLRRPVADLHRGWVWSRK
jgi:hypothetical protein